MEAKQCAPGKALSLIKLSKRKPAENARNHVYVEGEEIENVHSFVYLGSKIQCDGDDLADVKHRIAMN